MLYLLRPLTLERGCFLAEHTISGGSRTGGFWPTMRLKSRFVPQTKSGCSCVGGVAKWRRFLRNLRSAAASPGERKVYQTRRGDVSFVICPAPVELFPTPLFRSPGICFLPDASVSLFLLWFCFGPGQSRSGNADTSGPGQGWLTMPCGPAGSLQHVCRMLPDLAHVHLR